MILLESPCENVVNLTIYHHDFIIIYNINICKDYNLLKKNGIIIYITSYYKKNKEITKKYL